MISSKNKFLALIVLSRLLEILARFEKRCGKRLEKFTSVPVNEYICPREDDPSTFTECCENGGCCKKNSIFPEFDEELVMIVGVTVITACVILMAVLLICCFWSKCPCYTTCRANYTGSETIIYSLSKEDPNVLMPNESDACQYAPCLVKIKKVDEY